MSACACAQERAAGAEEDRAELQSRVEAMAERLKEAERAATNARSQVQTQLNTASGTEDELRIANANLAAAQEQLILAAQVCVGRVYACLGKQAEGRGAKGARRGR